jgi:hypothetical protein
MEENIKRKSFKDISWLVDEPTYRADPALSYSTLATFERGGFGCIPTLFDKKESPSLTFGSMVDTLVTDSQEEYDRKYYAADIEIPTKAFLPVVTNLFNKYHIQCPTLNDIPDDRIIEECDICGYQKAWNRKTRIDKIRSSCTMYYNQLSAAGQRQVVSMKEQTDAYNCLGALRESPQTRAMFNDIGKWDTDVEAFYQLKFKHKLDDIMYRCMADRIIIDHKNKVVTPIDLKTSSHKEYDFVDSFVKWNYDIQARLYWRIIRAVMDDDPYFKDFELGDYIFVVINRETLTPLRWLYKYTKTMGDIEFGKHYERVMRDPFVIGKELWYYLQKNPPVPFGVSIDGNNDIVKVLKEM